MPKLMPVSRALPLFLLLGSVLLAACSAPKPPDEERRPQPQARPTSAIVQTAEAYKDRARSVEAESLQAADRQRAEIDAQSR